MVTLSGFADEISPDLETQLDVLTSEGIRHMDFRGVFGKKAVDLNDDELALVKERLLARGVKVACIGSGIGKINIITGDLGKHMEDFHRTVYAAKALKARYIRLFSFYYISPGKPEVYREAILKQLRQYIRIAEREDVILLHENELRIYGDNLHNCLDLFEACPSSHFRAILDPANFLRTGVKPATHAYPALKPHLAYFHIKDSKFAGTKYVNVPAGEGDGELRELIAAVKRDGFSGVMGVEPHLQPRSPESFRRAAGALKNLLQEAGVPWN
ncbi:MAG: xylose isomerase [Paenibacillaceae bacterium]|nr:xylose isomerase [Paenibacillaceae bacterium]